MSQTANNDPRSAVECLYLPFTAGGLGMINVENLYYRRLVSIACHLYNSDDRLVKLCCDLDRVLPAHCSVLSRAREYCPTLSVPFDQDHSDFQLIFKILCDKQFAVLITTLLTKPLHGQFYKYVQSGKVDVQRSVRWLKIHLHSETVSTVRAIQDQVIATRVIQAKILHMSVPTTVCRVCGQAEETIVHLLAACPVLTLTAYLYRHNLVAAVLHWHLSKVYSLPIVSKSWYSHHPPPVVESCNVKLLWDFSLVTDYTHTAN